jgi:hypothetical protein
MTETLGDGGTTGLPLGGLLRLLVVVGLQPGLVVLPMAPAPLGAELLELSAGLGLGLGME